jgi:hypothetical protein
MRRTNHRKGKRKNHAERGLYGHSHVRGIDPVGQEGLLAHWCPPSEQPSFRIGVKGIVNLLSGLSGFAGVCHTPGMNTPSSHRCRHHRFPAELIGHGVWLYFRFCLGSRDGEELLFARGSIVT